MRFVLDTDVMVAAFRSERGASRLLIFHALEGRCKLLASTALWLEYEAVLTRPRQLEAMQLTALEVRSSLAILSRIVEDVPIRYQWRGILPDADDDLVLEAAVNGRADLLVTFNQSDFAIGLRQFRPRLARPAEALSWMR
ncbi:MAG: putative toxin-antitoxin system toxin component, PIN family [Gammaproteobacteria bacterium]